LWLIYLRITDHQFLEIFPEGEGDEVPGPHVTGYHHMCLAVPDIHKAVEELGAAGIPLLLSEKLGADGNWQCWIKDPDGNRIELMQLMPDSLQEQALARRR
jgi:lactoylglutathione lyase